MPDFTRDEWADKVCPENLVKDPYRDILGSNGKDTYRVRWDSKSDKFICSCPHFLYRLSVGNGKCKHILQAEMQGFKPPKTDDVPKDGRIPRAQIEPVARKALKVVSLYADKIEICGSYRRQKPTLKDLDFIVGLKEFDISRIKNIKDRVKEIASLVILDGDNRFTVLIDTIQVDFRFVLLKSWIYMLMHSTGSAGENIRMRQKALSRGFQLNEYGLWKKDTQISVFPDPTCEAEVYDFLGEKCKSPEER